MKDDIGGGRQAAGGQRDTDLRLGFTFLLGFRFFLLMFVLPIQFSVIDCLVIEKLRKYDSQYC